MGSPGIIHNSTSGNASQFSGHGCMDDPTTERSFDSPVTWVIDMLGLIFDMLSLGVCTTSR